jgi:hypothetical protein
MSGSQLRYRAIATDGLAAGFRMQEICCCVLLCSQPTSIQRGQTSTLHWEVTGSATSVSINQGLGTLQSTGSKRVSPSDSTTYTLTTTGPGGSSTASATVNVSAPPPPPAGNHYH